MFDSSNREILECSDFNDIENEPDWFERVYLPLEHGIRKGSAVVQSRKLDFLRDSDDSFNMPGVLESLSTAQIPIVPSTNYEYLKKSSNKSFGSQTFLGMQTNSRFQQQEDNCSPSSQDSNANVRNINSTFTVGLTIPAHKETNLQCPHNASVEIKVEVDPNLYVRCETPAHNESWSATLSKGNNSIVVADNFHGKNGTCLGNSHCKNQNSYKTLDDDLNTNRPKYLCKSSESYKPQNQLLDSAKANCDGDEMSVNSETADDSEESASCQTEEDVSQNCDTAGACNSEEQIENQLNCFYKFECEKCKDETFSSFELLDKHCRNEHLIKGFVHCCGECMSDKDRLIKHMLVHKHKYRCADCRKSFANKAAWRSHMKQHLSKCEDEPFQCPRCDKKFSSKYGLANHMNLHLPEVERPFKCRHCNKGFGAKHAMTKHERTHLPDAERLSYVCDICGKRFGYASTLDGHQRHIHQNERPFVCHICAKTFPIKGALTYHLTTHEEQDRVQCGECGIW